MSETNAVPGQSGPGSPPQGAEVPQPAPTPLAGYPPGATIPPGAVPPPGVTGAPGVAPPVGQKKGLGCWAIGAIVVGALLVLGALVTLVFAMFVANEVDDMATDLTTGGGVYATTEYDSANFLLADDEVVFDDSDLRVEVLAGELLVTSRNADQFNMATWETDEPVDGLLMSGLMSFPASTTASGQEVFGGVTVGMADDVDYVLLCSTEGGARLERLEPMTSAEDSAILKEFANAGCSGAFTLGLEVYSPAGATDTEILGTLPSGETFTFTDAGAHGQVVGYGLLVDADTAPVTMAVSSMEVYSTP